MYAIAFDDVPQFAPAVAFPGSLPVLSATSLPAQSAGYFVGSMTQAFVPNPGGSVGNLCIAGDVARFACDCVDADKSA